MTIRFAAAWRGHFAAAWAGSSPVLQRALCISASLDASNDNADRKQRASAMPVSMASRSPANDERLLTAALRHFARHGLSAADHARRNAEAARDAGDEEACTWWIEICRQLDRRMAGNFEKKLARRG